MKRYKLLKDLPTFKAGEIFYINDGGSLIRESDGVVAYSWVTIDKFPNILTEWFEEIKESTRWRPEISHDYYYVSSSGAVYDDVWSDTPNIDHNRFDIGNCFQTEEEAERAVEYLKALATVRGDATSKFARDRNNFYVYYDIISNHLAVGVSFYDLENGIFGLPYFATTKDAQRSIEQHKNEWLTIFGVKEGDEAQK